MDPTYIVVFQDGSKKRYVSNEIDLSAYTKYGPVSIYTKDDFIKQYGQAEYDREFGPEDREKPAGTLLDKMESAGEPTVKKQDSGQEDEDAYRQNITDTLQHLQEAGDQVFSHALNLAMKGELKDFDDAFEEGTVMKFNQADLENLSDANVLKLMGLLNAISATMDSLQNINGINEGE